MLRSATLLAVALVWSTDAFHGASRWTAPQRMGPLASSSEAAAPSTETSPPSSTDCLVSALSADGFVSAKAVVSTELVRTIVDKQEALPLAAAALGRAITCSLMLAEGMEQDETFQVRFKGEGPLRGVLAIANGNLEARGFCGNPRVNLPLNELGKIDVGGGVGPGQLFVVRTKNLPGETQATPYSSITEIHSGEVADDINHFLVESEQKDGALAAGVHAIARRRSEAAANEDAAAASARGEDDLRAFAMATAAADDAAVDAAMAAGGDADAEASNEDLFCEVVAAGGWHVHLMPGATDEVAAALMENLAAMTQSPSQMVRAGIGPEEMVRKLLHGMEPTVYAPRTPTFRCTCSMDRLVRTLAMLPKREIEAICRVGAQEEDGVKSKCEFCGTVYKLAPDEVRDELAKFAAIADVQARAAAPSDDADGEFRDGVVDLNGGATDNPRAP